MSQQTSLSAFVLLPPSESKTADDPHRPSARAGWTPDLGHFGRRLGEARAELAAALRACGGGDATLLGVRGAHLERARNANLGLIGAPVLPAWQRYDGVVWEHLDPASLSVAQRRRLLVASGLLGLVRGDDPIPDYRLKMGARLGSIGVVARWWQPHLAPVVAALARRSLIIDLLAVEQRGALARPTGTGITVLIQEPMGRSGGHAAKAAKGRLARHLLHALDRRGVDSPPKARAAAEAAVASWRDERFVAVVEEW